MHSDAIKHLSFIHENTDGWITLAKKEKGQFSQRHYKFEEIAHNLAKFPTEDIYFSQNSFFKPRRRVQDIKELKTLYVDIDCYTMGYQPEWVLGKIELELFKKVVPDPNLVLHSGRGLCLVWKIETASYKELRLWQRVEDYLVKQFEYVGADPKAKDASRVFRIAGSTNTKSGNVVRLEMRHEFKYSLDEIVEDYLPLEEQCRAHPEKKRVQKIKKKRPTISRQRDNVSEILNVRTLYYTRLEDLSKLVEIRNYELYKCRELICFIYRALSCFYCNDAEKALQNTLQLNRSLSNPLEDDEVIKATKSAEERWLEKLSEADTEDKKLGYIFSNRKIIDWLDITSDEQKHLKTIIGKEEKYRRNNEARTIKRRKAGVIERKDYITLQKEKTKKKLMELTQLIHINPNFSNYKLAEIMNISEAYIRKLKKKL